MLRGINVGGKKVEMEKLRSGYISLGLQNVRSYIQSGNVVFESSNHNIPELTSSIEKKIKSSWGFDVAVFIRNDNEIRRIVENNPFGKRDQSKLHVTFLRKEPQQFPFDEIGKVKTKSEDVSFSSKEIYLFCPNGYGNTKLSNAFFERKLKTLATTRNWNTVNTLLSMVSG
jgi:uncharacterized protein (DUF1697 family)